MRVKATENLYKKRRHSRIYCLKPDCDHKKFFHFRNLNIEIRKFNILFSSLSCHLLFSNSNWIEQNLFAQISENSNYTWLEEILFVA